MTAVVALIARVTDPYWPSPLPFDFDDIHTASIVIAGASSALLAEFCLKIPMTRAALVGVFAILLNFLLFVGVGFIFLALH